MFLKMILPAILGVLLMPSQLSPNSESENHLYSIGDELEYLAQNGKFGITMPGEYTVSKVVGESTNTIKVTSTIGEETYLFSWTLHTELLGDHKGLADVSLESFNEQVQGDILNQDIYKYKSNEGKKATISLMEGQAICFYRVILMEQYQFQMVVVTGDTELDEAGEKFLDSFKYSE